jgi:hypothetical protein
VLTVSPVTQVLEVETVKPALKVKAKLVLKVMLVPQVTKVLEVNQAEDSQVSQERLRCQISLLSSTLSLNLFQSTFTPLYLKTLEAKANDLNTTWFLTTKVKAIKKTKAASSLQPTVSTFSKPTLFDVKTLVNSTSI